MAKSGGGWQDQEGEHASRDRFGATNHSTAYTLGAWKRREVIPRDFGTWQICIRLQHATTTCCDITIGINTYLYGSRIYRRSSTKWRWFIRQWLSETPEDAAALNFIDASLMSLFAQL